MTIIQPTDASRAIVAAEREKLAAQTAEAMRAAKAREAYRKRLGVLKKAVADSQQEPAVSSISDADSVDKQGHQARADQRRTLFRNHQLLRERAGTHKVEEPEEHAAMIAEYKSIEADRNGSDA